MYYTAIIFICIFSMLIVQISIHESNTLDKHTKTLFHLIFSGIALAAFCEWTGACLQGHAQTRILHFEVKLIELSIVPCIGVLFGWIIEERSTKRALFLLFVHAILEFISGLTGFIYKIDVNSVYTHGKFYWIYVIAFIASIVYAVYILLRNVKRYQYNGIRYYFAIAIFLVVGIIIQSIDSRVKIDYVVLSMTATMLYILTLEMVQQTDGLSQLINRRGYENYINHMDECCCIIFLDIDQFKTVNDVYGHSFGDECIRLTSHAIKDVYMKYGKCFRFGGDEFCVILTKKLSEIEKLNHEFFKTIEVIRKHEKRMPYVSLGYVLYNPKTDNIVEKIEEVDQMMYQYKEKHREM